ncbi:MAG TPA: hypothetical protein VFT22_36165, partial [Kofleriaceae bacterium]|nr:hypothetical protein [Kofleriaceae bacterium]
ARLADVVAAAGGHELRLAVAGRGPRGFSAPAALPIALVARPAARAFHLELGAGSVDRAIEAARAAAPADLARAPVAITVEPGVEVDGLATLLATLAARGVRSAAVVRSPAKSAAPKPHPAKP